VVLAELSVMEQRFHAVMECLGGTPKTEVAARYGVSRQTIHNWLARYAAEGVRGLEDRSHRPRVCPHGLTPRRRRWCVSCAGIIRGGVRVGCGSRQAVVV
jgi:hypothetical protein